MPSPILSRSRTTVRTELRRIRERISHAFGDSSGKDAPRVPQRHAVPARLTIAEVMEGNLAVVSPETPIRVALTLMIANRISSVPVVDADRRIVGALNERDLMKVFYEPGADRVERVMTRNPVTFAIDAPLVDVVDRLMASDFRRVLIHENERLVGVITRSHLMPALLDALEGIARSRDEEPRSHQGDPPRRP